MRTAQKTVTYALPPLILHPFTDASGPDRLLQSSRANLILQGLLPPEELEESELETLLLDGRMCEIRMLFYVGRDVNRWIEQCLEFVERLPEFEYEDIRAQDFMQLLISNTPPEVEEKLGRWGVGDFRAIFSRGLGLHSVFREVPGRNMLTAEFIRNYYRYADQMFACLKERAQHRDLRELGFTFELYASGEYTRMLEEQWSTWKS